jgi:phospholipase/carboxylesterase
VLSVRGTVLENGMPRFFRRLREGVFDEDDLRVRVDELAAFLSAAEAEYGVAPGAWTAVGFSNGANIASALLFGHPDALAGAVLLAAMVPYRDGPPEVDLAGRRVLVANGRRDPMATPQQTETLVGQLRARGPTSPTCRTAAGTPSTRASSRRSPGGCGVDPHPHSRIRALTNTIALFSPCATTPGQIDRLRS